MTTTGAEQTVASASPEPLRYFPPFGPPTADDPRLLPAPTPTPRKLRVKPSRTVVAAGWSLTVVLLLAALVRVGLPDEAMAYCLLGAVGVSIVMSIVSLHHRDKMRVAKTARRVAVARYQQAASYVTRHNAHLVAVNAYLDQDHVMGEELANQRVWGTPGQLSASRFGVKAAEVGRAAELATAAQLDEAVAELPGARIFHGLRWPGTDLADIDHAVLCGDRLALIDTKVWQQGAYWWDGRQLYREGELLKTPATGEAAKVLQQWVSTGSQHALSTMADGIDDAPAIPLSVKPWVVLQGSGVTVENVGSREVTLTTGDRLGSEVAAWLSAGEQADVVDRRLLLALRMVLKREPPAASGASRTAV